MFYLSIIISHTLSRTAELVAYQCIIASASIQYPPSDWPNYDTQFRTLAAQHAIPHNAFIAFCVRFNIQPLPASFLTLQYFSVDIAQHVSYKTLKVYLAGICLLHIKNGFLDPTDDNLLQLVCHRICHQQGDHQRSRLPITIHHLCTLKTQPQVSNYSFLEQRMLWASFTLAFYGFLHIRK